MNIGFLALGFVLFCIPLALFGMLQPSEASEDPLPDYTGIYKAMTPREL